MIGARLHSTAWRQLQDVLFHLYIEPQTELLKD